ncbi:hypothetical protein M5689_016756 [Euphorbia peplus]|nr:hypothetical protein M5689_016756 [Euphorbia peplus]
MRSRSSMKKHLRMVLVVVMILICLQLSMVNCRVLREDSGVTAFSVKSKNNASVSSSSLGSLMFPLASGPSKKGPGH